MDIISLPNNTLVAAFNDSPDKRTPLRLATSTNGGVTWTRQALIEDDPTGSFHYPALLYDPKNVSAAMCPVPQYVAKKQASNLLPSPFRWCKDQKRCNQYLDGAAEHGMCNDGD